MKVTTPFYPNPQSTISLQAILACMGGNIIEWYDFMIYGYFSGIIGRVFFPPADQIASLLLSLSVFAIGVIARPIGGIFMGHIGDKISRKSSLLMSIYLMFGSTLMIGLLPSYQTIGLMAPIFLFVLRILQGLAMGGEYAGTMVFLIESSPENKRGFYGSLATLSLVIGMALGAGMAALVNFFFQEEEILNWAWRIPFFVSFLGVLYTLYMRKTLNDPREFSVLKETNNIAPNPFKVMWAQYSPLVLKCILFQTVLAIGMYTVTVYSNNYIREFLPLSKTQGFLVNMIATVVLGISAVLSGLISDWIGRRTVIITSCLAIIICSFLSVYLSETREMMYFFYSQILLLFSVGQFLGVTPSALAEHFPIQLRYTAMAFTNNIVMAIFGGTAPLVILYGISLTGDPFIPAYYLTFGALVSLAFGLILFPAGHCSRRETPWLAK